MKSIKITLVVFVLELLVLLQQASMTPIPDTPGTISFYEEKNCIYLPAGTVPLHDEFNITTGCTRLSDRASIANRIEIKNGVCVALYEANNNNYCGKTTYVELKSGEGSGGIAGRIGFTEFRLTKKVQFIRLCSNETYETSVRFYNKGVRHLNEISTACQSLSSLTVGCIKLSAGKCVRLFDVPNCLRRGKGLLVRNNISDLQSNGWNNKEIRSFRRETCPE